MTVARAIVTSPEENQRLVDASYQQWLERPPDDAGRAFFTAQLPANRMADDLLVSLLASDEFFKSVAKG